MLETLEGKFQQKRLSQAAILTHEHVFLLGFQRVHPKCQSTSPPHPCRIETPPPSCQTRWGCELWAAPAPEPAMFPSLCPQSCSSSVSARKMAAQATGGWHVPGAAPLALRRGEERQRHSTGSPGPTGDAPHPPWGKVMCWEPRHQAGAVPAQPSLSAARASVVFCACCPYSHHKPWEGGHISAAQGRSGVLPVCCLGGLKRSISSWMKYGRFPIFWALDCIFHISPPA